MVNWFFDASLLTGIFIPKSTETGTEWKLISGQLEDVISNHLYQMTRLLQSAKIKS